MTRRWVHAVALFAVLVAAACRRPGDESDSRPERPRSTNRDPYLIEGDELKVATAQSLYDVVRIQRPNWLTKTVKTASGSDAVVVYLDDRKLGMLNILREMRVELAVRMRYLSPTEAQLRYGPNHGSLAAIVIEVAK